MKTGNPVSNCCGPGRLHIARHSYGLTTILVVLAVVSGLSPAPSLATAIVVPDDVPNIQSAVHALPDTVLVRSGTYDEDVLLFRGISLLGYGTDAYPQLSRISFEPTGDPTSTDVYNIQSLSVSRGILFRNNLRPIFVTINRCSLPGGVADSSLDAETGTVLIMNCSILNNVRVLVRGSLVLDSCHVVGNVSAGYGNATLRVWNSIIEGDGGGVGIASEGFPTINRASVYGNRITGFARGIGIAAENDVYVRGNIIEGAGTCGVTVTRSNEAYIDSNRVEVCGDGVIMDGVTNGYINANVIARSIGTGIRLMGERCATAVVGGNVVVFGGGNGIEVLSQVGVGGVTNNTIAENSGTGLVMATTEDAKYGPFEVARNVSAFNRQYGIEWLTSAATTGGCNDWFGNKIGNVWGRDPAVSDFVEDPLFCNPSEDDFRVDAASPLRRAGCDGVGALGMGCGKTETLVRRFEAARVIEGIQVLWEVGEGASAPEIWVERSESAFGGGWVRPLTERSFEGGTTVDLDRSALPDRAYTYRLVADERGDVVVLASGVTVEAKEPRESGLREVGPNPSRGVVRIVISLKAAGWIELGLYDMHGRRVLSLCRGMWPGGRHAVDWNGRSSKGDAVPSGLYILRYAYPGGMEERAIVRR